MIRISDFYSLVKTFFKNIFSFKLSFEQQFKLFITKAFEILFRVYVKKVDDRFFYSNERKDRFKSKGFIWNVEEVEIHIWGWLLYIVELRSSARTGTSSLTSIQ